MLSKYTTPIFWAINGIGFGYAAIIATSQSGGTSTEGVFTAITATNIIVCFFVVAILFVDRTWVQENILWVGLLLGLPLPITVYMICSALKIW